MAALAALQQAMNQAGTLINSSFGQAVYSNYTSNLFSVMNNVSAATNYASSRVFTNQQTTAQQHQDIAESSVGLGGYGTTELFSQLNSNLTSTSSANAATLNENLNNVTTAGAMKINSENSIISDKLNNVSNYSSIGGAGFGLLGSVVGGIIGLTKGGKDGDAGNSSTVGYMNGQQISGTQNLNLQSIQYPEQQLEHVSVNTNNGFVGGHVGTASSVGTINTINTQVSNINSAIDNQAVTNMNTTNANTTTNSGEAQAENTQEVADATAFSSNA